MYSFYKRPKLRKMDVRFGIWNVRNLYRAGSLRAVVEEISKYKLDLVGTRVEAGSNTSTVNLRVVRGDEMGLKKAAP
jgi:hypothetical protein